MCPHAGSFVEESHTGGVLFARQAKIGMRELFFFSTLFTSIAVLFFSVGATILAAFSVLVVVIGLVVNIGPVVNASPREWKFVLTEDTLLVVTPSGRVSRRMEDFQKLYIDFLGEEEAAYVVFVDGYIKIPAECVGSIRQVKALAAVVGEHFGTEKVSKLQSEGDVLAFREILDSIGLAQKDGATCEAKVPGCPGS